MKTFTFDQFTPTKWDTAEDKSKFANRFVKFVESGFKQSLFTKKFYNRLSNTFGHIAHYNQGGFWDTFFTSLPNKVAFIEQSVTYQCYGDPAWTYSDVERALQSWLMETGIILKLREEADKERVSAEMATLVRLKSKYDMA